MTNGTILKGIGGFYYIDTETGVYECRARGIFRKDKTTPTVGDKVEISILDEENKKGSLDKILKRRNELIRPRVSNVDTAVIVFAAQSPAMNLDLLDRFLVLVAEQELDVVICINKIELDKTEKYIQSLKIYESAGYKVIFTSAETGYGIDNLRDILVNKISVFAGPSGVGKSSLLNKAFSNLHLETGIISEKIQRGKHTTRHAELIQIGKDSYIVDSPGFTSLALTHIDKEDLQRYFLEFSSYIYKCHYTGCSHIHEPSCAIKEQVGITISKKRYNRYVFLYQELAKMTLTEKKIGKNKQK